MNGTTIFQPYSNEFQATNMRPSSSSSNFISQNQSQPRLTYFIQRNNGNLVPLIPADELPYNMRLQGVPRLLNSDQVFGLQQVGFLPYTGQVFKLENEASGPRSSSQPPSHNHARSLSSNEVRASLPPDALARQALGFGAQVHGGNSILSRPTPAHEAATNWRKAPASDPQAVIDAIVGTESGAEAAARIGYVPKSRELTPPSGNTPDPEKKEYCTYWLRTGECDYAQQGCLYKHEMPDKATLAKIGFRSTPKWWLEKNSLFKSGGERATVGPIVKSSVWLKSKTDQTADNDDTESDTSDSDSTAAGPCAKKRTSEVKVTDSSTATKNAATLVRHDSARTGLEGRQQSTSGDLIDFGPLLPAPSTATPAAGAAVLKDDSTQPKIKTALASPALQPRIGEKTQSTSNKKIFVPAGESPEVHIAEAKKKAGYKEPTVEKQIQQPQKTKHKSDLMASKHAVPVGGTKQSSERAVITNKGVAKAGCRVRRLASPKSASATT